MSAHLTFLHLLKILSVERLCHSTPYTLPKVSLVTQLGDFSGAKWKGTASLQTQGGCGCVNYLVVKQVSIRAAPGGSGVVLLLLPTPSLQHPDPPCRVSRSVHWWGTEPGRGAGTQSEFSAWFSQFARWYALGLADGCSVLQCCSIKALPMRLLWKQFVLFVFLDRGSFRNRLRQLPRGTWLFILNGLGAWEFHIHLPDFRACQRKRLEGGKVMAYFSL